MRHSISSLAALYKELLVIAFDKYLARQAL
jgi:hypothetical protein